MELSELEPELSNSTDVLFRDLLSTGDSASGNDIIKGNQCLFQTSARKTRNVLSVKKGRR